VVKQANAVTTGARVTLAHIQPCRDGAEQAALALDLDGACRERASGRVVGRAACAPSPSSASSVRRSCSSMAAWAAATAAAMASAENANGLTGGWVSPASTDGRLPLDCDRATHKPYWHFNVQCVPPRPSHTEAFRANSVHRAYRSLPNSHFFALTFRCRFFY